MDEFLKTVRLLHQVLIGVCSALLAFSLSPDVKTQYTAALVELDVILHRLTFHDYVLYAQQMAHREDESEALYLKRRFERERILVNKHVLPLSPDFSVRRPFFCEYPKDNATVAEYLQFFDSGGQIGEVGFSYGEIPGVPVKLEEILHSQDTNLATLEPEWLGISFELSEDTPREDVASDGATRLLQIPRLHPQDTDVIPPDQREFRGELGLTFRSKGPSMKGIGPFHVQAYTEALLSKTELVPETRC